MLRSKLGDGAAGGGLFHEGDVGGRIAFLVEDDEPVLAVHEPAFRQIEAVDGDFLRIAAQVVAVEPDEAARQAGQGDAQDGMRAGGGGRRGGEFRAVEGRNAVHDGAVKGLPERLRIFGIAQTAAHRPPMYRDSLAGGQRDRDRTGQAFGVYFVYGAENVEELVAP